MALTGMLGTPQSQPGMMQPGYFCTGKAVWTGPGKGDTAPFLRLSAVYPGNTITVPLAVASQLAAADQSWWVFH